MTSIIVQCDGCGGVIDSNEKCGTPRAIARKQAWKCSKDDFERPGEDLRPNCLGKVDAGPRGAALAEIHTVLAAESSTTLSVAACGNTSGNYYLQVDREVVRLLTPTEIASMKRRG